MEAGKSDTARRRKGRPKATGSGVGRDVLIQAARELLQELPPAQVTSTAVARRAGADPALVRYYFGNRESLLLEVAKLIAREAHRPPSSEDDPVKLLAQIVEATFRFTRSARNMQRLMIEELDSARSPEMRERVREWNRQPVLDYARIRELDSEGLLVDFDPLFLHLAVIGISDFFVTGAPLIELLAPEGTDIDELGRRYQDFVTRLLTDGLRRRADG